MSIKKDKVKKRKKKLADIIKKTGKDKAKQIIPVTMALGSLWSESSDAGY